MVRPALRAAPVLEEHMRNESWISGGIGIFLTGIVLFPIIIFALEYARVIGVVVFSLIFLWVCISLIIDIVRDVNDGK